MEGLQKSSQEVVNTVRCSKVLLWFWVLLLPACGTSELKESTELPPEGAEPALVEEQPMTSRAPPPSGPVEVTPPDEIDTIAKTLSLIESSYTRRRGQRPILRVAYAKGSGCAAGTLTVAKSIPPKLRWGVFSDPGKGFPIWARFSSGNGGVTLPDTTRDLRGMAIKLIGVVGPKLLDDSEKSTQDFLFQNSPTFPAKDAAGFLKLLTAAQKRGEPGASFRGNQAPIANPLHERYWSAVPFRLGDTAVKYQIVPTDCKSGKPFSQDNEQVTRWANANSLRDEMRKTLAKGRACFALEAQTWKDEVTTPIEDPTTPWPTPFARIAWVVLEKADAKVFAKNSLGCEQMAFSAWHGITEFQPLGGINRLSKEVYSLSARIRRKMNYWPESEPGSTARPAAKSRSGG